MRARTIRLRTIEQLESRVTPTTSSTWTTQLNLTAMSAQLAAAPAEYAVNPIELALPRPDGSTARFHVWQAKIMSPELAAQLPTMHTFRGQGIDHPADILAADVGPTGFHAQVIGPGTLWSIDPINLTSSTYRSAVPEVSPGHPNGCTCALCQAAINTITATHTSNISPPN